MSTSFLTTGRWAKPALGIHSALGEDPRAIIRRAVLSGLVSPPPPQPKPTGRPLKYHNEVERRAANRAYHQRYQKARRASLKAAGLNVSTGKPLRNQSHPELRGLSHDEYHRRYMLARRKGKAAAC